MTERLDKWLCARTLFSRKDVKALIKSGRVQVDGRTLTDADAHVGEEAAVMLDGNPVMSDKHVYIMLNKPQGVVSVSNAPDDRTVIDLLPAHMRRSCLFPAGRLDRDTTGFVLITDDGDFAHRILSPRRHVTKTYSVTLRDPIADGYEDAFREGIVLGDGSKCLSAQLLRTGDPYRAVVRIREGRYHQIKRMFASLGNQVIGLHRDAIGGLSLDPSLPCGACRYLSPEEVRILESEA